MRVAIYFIPPHDHELTVHAAAWLGRDVYTGAAIMPAPGSRNAGEHRQLTEDARRYGFHATIKAPFRLAAGCTIDQLADRLGTFAARMTSVDLTLRIGQLGSFFAYIPVENSPSLNALASSVVAEFDHFRAPLSETDLARRKTAGLSERQLSHLMSWGYPYVFDQFRFHMTLTGPVSPLGIPDVQSALDQHFGAAPRRIEVGQLVVAVEPQDAEPFTVHSVHALAQVGARIPA